MQFRLKEKYKRWILIAAVALILLFLFNVVKNWYITKDMTPEERTIYREQQEESAQGYRLLTSHQLTEEEKLMKELFECLKSGDTFRACQLMGVPDTFDSSTYNEWLKENELSALLSYDIAEIGVVSQLETVEETENYQTVTHEELAYYLFAAADNTIRCRFICEEEQEGMVFVPEKGIVRDYVLLAPVKALYEHSVNPEDESAEDLSVYVKTTVDQPYLSAENWSTVWYQFEFPRFLDCEPHFILKSDLGTFESEYVEVQPKNSSNTSDMLHTVLAVIPDETVNEILGKANESLEKIYELLKAQASEAEIGRYLLSAAVLETCSQNEANYAQIYETLQTVTGSTLYYNKEAFGTLPLVYNCRIAESDGVIVKVNALIDTTMGECRKVTTLHLRYLDGIWKIVDMDISNNNNLFTDVTTFDPQW